MSIARTFVDAPHPHKNLPHHTVDVFEAATDSYATPMHGSARVLLEHLVPLLACTGNALTNWDAESLAISRANAECGRQPTNANDSCRQQPITQGIGIWTSRRSDVRSAHRLLTLTDGRALGERAQNRAQSIRGSSDPKKNRGQQWCAACAPSGPKNWLTADWWPPDLIL